MESYDEIRKFTVTELCNWLEDKEDITEDITVVETNRVNGKTFVDLSDDDLNCFDCSAIESCTKNCCKSEATASTSLCKPYITS